jgi:hypothetical protein
VFLGTCDGTLIWSGLDALGQDAAVAFNTNDEARRFLDELPGPFPGCEVVEVEADVFHEGRVFASVAAVQAAGLAG